jgi:hypothetical protein
VHTHVLVAGWPASIAGAVRRPEHGPGIDVVELTSASWAVLTITLRDSEGDTLSSGIVTRKSAPIMGNSPVLAIGHQSKSAQNVSHRDYIDYQPRCRLIEKLGSSVCNFPPPNR